MKGGKQRMNNYINKHKGFESSHKEMKDLPDCYKIQDIFNALISCDRRQDWKNFNRIFSVSPDILSVLLFRYMKGHVVNLTALSSDEKDKLFLIGN